MADLDLKKVKVKNNFWFSKQALIRDVVIPFQEKVLHDEIPDVEKSGAIENFKVASGLKEGTFYGEVFQDTDIAKWLEGVAYSLIVTPNEDLERRADEVIDLLEKTQMEDGYLNTFFQIEKPDNRWEDLLECHELYTAGHMLEAAVAYFEATGKRKFLDVMQKMADHIYDHFGYDKTNGIPGHQEIEIGLMRLYHITNDKKYLDLAKYFIDFRGENPNFFAEEDEKRSWFKHGTDPKNTYYNQSHLPVREQKVAVGHAVRAVYMYTAMADIAKETNDQTLIDACETLWENITNKQMYITGGIGSTVHGESFTVDYDLPNDTIYAETCASIAMVFFAKKMLDIKPLGKYADIMELELYNGIMSGIQLDGKQFFYVNPLEVNPGISGVLKEYKHVIPVRPGWYFCACCPPNIVRLVMSIGKYAWDEVGKTIFNHLYLDSVLETDKAKIIVETDYPWDGHIKYTLENVVNSDFEMALHIPSHAKNVKITLNNNILDATIKDGYAYIKNEWSNGDEILITFDMPVRKVRCNTKVRENIGKVSIMRGPVVYAFEGVDHEEDLQELWHVDNAKIKECSGSSAIIKDTVTLEIEGLHLQNTESLYSENLPTVKKTTLKAIPYFAWCNRGLNKMRVWLPEYLKLDI